ncbi:MAG TPA: periplasmic heavy metal sensor [Candidatus Obscuribacterales bacterium]
MTSYLRYRALAVFTALAASTTSTLAAMQPAEAGNATTATKLIDRPFEECLIKHFQARFFNRIDATAEQRQKLSDIFARRAEETRPFREQLRQGMLELSDMMARDDVSDEQLTAKAHEVRQLRERVADERLKSVLAVRAVLTPAQRQQISGTISGLISGQWKRRLGSAP